MIVDNAEITSEAVQIEHPQKTIEELHQAWLSDLQVRLLPPLRFDKVDLLILDESSQVYTGSIKAFEAIECVTDCVREGIDEICFTSGTNLGTALTAFANRVGITTHFFVPAKNVWKLDYRFLSSPLSHIYAVEDADRAKELCQEFSIRSEIPRLPKLDQRLRASRKRGEIINSLLGSKLQCDWFAQTVSAGFGPIGIYDFLMEKHKAGLLSQVPRFLAVQQASNCILAKYLASKRNGFKLAIDPQDGQLIEDTMYDKHPETYGTFTAMEFVLHASNGAVVTVRREEFDHQLLAVGSKIIMHLEQHGMVLSRTRRSKNELEIIQKSGLLTLVGVLKAVAKRIIPPGQRVLCSFSGGATQGNFQPLPDGYAIQISEPYEESLSKITEAVNQRRLSV